MADSISMNELRLRSLPFLARLGLTFAVLTLCGGYLAAGVFIMDHHGPRDGREGLSLDDVEGVYHGVTVQPVMLDVLRAGHPNDLLTGEGDEKVHEDDLAHLIAWLESGRVAEDYANIDLNDGYGSPEEVMADACMQCHARSGEGMVPPALEFWDDVAAVAQPREVLPTDEALLLASTHAHAPAMAAIACLAIVLGCLTFWPSFLVGLCALGSGLGLVVDIGSWWIARETPGLAPVIVAGGAAHSFGTCALFAMVIVELWRPRG